MGEFISLLVDAGHDPAVKFRVLEDIDCRVEGHFIRRLEVVMLPDGVVEENLVDTKGVHEALVKLLEAGVIK